jgi:hypothetical protein
MKLNFILTLKPIWLNAPLCHNTLFTALLASIVKPHFGHELSLSNHKSQLPAVFWDIASQTRLTPQLGHLTVKTEMTNVRLPITVPTRVGKYRETSSQMASG